MAEPMQNPNKDGADDMAVASLITMAVQYDPEREGEYRAGTRSAVGNNPDKCWGSVSLPNDSPFYNINMWQILFRDRRPYEGPTEPGGGYKPQAIGSFAGLAHPPGVKTNSDVARAFPLLGTAYFEMFATSPSNYETNLASISWGGFGMMPLLGDQPIEPGTYVRAERPPLDKAGANTWENTRHATSKDPRGKFPAILKPASPYDGADSLRDSMHKYLTGAGFVKYAPSMLFNNNNFSAGPAGFSADRDTERALMQQQFVMTSAAVVIRVLMNAGVLKVTTITNKANWEERLTEMDGDIGSYEWDDATSKFTKGDNPGEISRRKHEANERFIDVMQMLGLLSSSASFMGSQAGFNNATIVSNVMSALYNDCLSADIKESADASTLMPGASAGGQQLAVATLKQHASAAFPNMATAVLDAHSEASSDVLAFTHTGGVQGGSVAAQLAL